MNFKKAEYKRMNQKRTSSKVDQKLRIRTLEHLANQLKYPKSKLIEIANDTSLYYYEFDKNVKGKMRHLLSTKHPLDIIQRRILERVLLRLPVYDCSYGAIKGKSILQNAKIHSKSLYIAKFDIKDFYPSIRYQKVYNFFVESDCSPDVARILTLLTTRNYALPLGTSTSPFLADQIVRSIDDRIYGMARKAKLQYTRYVDDIVLSGNYPIENFTNTVFGVIKQSGFKIKKSKLEIYTPDDGKERIITGVKVHHGKTFAPKDYITSLQEDLEYALIQSQHQNPKDIFYSKNQYRGKIGFVQWVDKQAGNQLMKLYRKVKWKHLEWALEKT